MNRCYDGSSSVNRFQANNRPCRALREGRRIQKVSRNGDYLPREPQVTPPGIACLFARNTKPNVGLVATLVLTLR